MSLTPQHPLGVTLALIASPAHHGLVIARCEHASSVPTYRLRMPPSATGEPREHWWAETEVTLPAPRAEASADPTTASTAESTSNATHPLACAHAMGATLTITTSGETGRVVGRGDFTESEPSYLLRYTDGMGSACERWWSESALQTEPLTIPAVTPDPLAPLAIGAHWAAQGGIFAGLCRGVDGQPDHHLILGRAHPDLLPWSDAIAWAQGLQQHGFTDWALPTRAESAVLFGNLRDRFEPAWYWTGEPHSSAFAWAHGFANSGQAFYDKSFEGRAHVVRRLILQSLGHS